MPQRKILVADDSRVFRATVRRTLAHAGYDVTLAADGEEAVQLARREQPDLVILDVHMPIKDGYSACEEILASDDRETPVPIVFLTCDRAKHLAALGDDLGAYLTKPVTDELLLKTIHRLLHGTAQSETCAGISG